MQNGRVCPAYPDSAAALTPASGVYFSCARTSPPGLAALWTFTYNSPALYAFNWSGTKMKAGLGINNLFNRDYYFRGVDYSQGRMPQPGRAVMATLQVDL